MNIVLVREGNKYSAEYTNKLRKMIWKFSGQYPIVLGEDIELKYDLKGWWAKMELFADHDIRPCLYLDLDTIITQDISELLVEPEKFLMCTEWIDDSGKGQSSVMQIPKETDIWDRFWPNHERIMQDFGGDQDFLSTCEWGSLTDRYPGYIGSYRLHNKGSPVNRIVCFHGKPKPHEAPGWAGEMWKG